MGCDSPPPQNSAVLLFLVSPNKLTVDVITFYGKEYFSEVKALDYCMKHKYHSTSALNPIFSSYPFNRCWSRPKQFVLYYAVFNFYMHCGFCSTVNTWDQSGFMGWTCFYFNRCCTFQHTILKLQPVVPHQSFKLLFRVSVSSNKRRQRLVPFALQLLTGSWIYIQKEANKERVDHLHPHHPLDYSPLFFYGLKETVKCKFLASKTRKHKGRIEA